MSQVLEKSENMPNLLRSGLLWLWIGVVIVILDRISKDLAQEYLSSYSALSVMPGFNLVLSFNKGAAFSFLDQAAGWQVWMFAAIAVAVSVSILVWLARLSWRDCWISIGLSLIIGGALGNLWDRISYGHVIDFIQLYVAQFYWPVFNIADSAICVGAFMLIWNSFYKKVK